MPPLTRRDLLKTAATGGLAALLPGAAGRAVAAAEAREEGFCAPVRVVHPLAASAPASAASGEAAPRRGYRFFHAEEAAFLEAAVARLIPSDPKLPGALDADVPNYLDQLCGSAWGSGEQLYRAGPWQKGTKAQGYQLPFTPAELYRVALAAINAEHAARGTPFDQLSGEAQDAYLHELEHGADKDLGGVPGDVFFGVFWENTLEGYFADPVHGGNRGMVTWRALGFPGAYASYYDVVDQHQIVIDRPPVSIAEGGTEGHAH